MKRNQIPLSALRAFEAAGRHESFQNAASELLVTASAISRQIADLETFVGGKLFVRTPRKVKLTAEGQILRESLTQAFDKIIDTLVEVKTANGIAQQTAPISVCSSPTFAVRMLAPNLSHFSTDFPNNLVELSTTQITPNKIQADIRIEYSKLCPEDESCILFQEEAYTVCSPLYVGYEELIGSGASQICKEHLISTTPDFWDWEIWAQNHKVRWPNTLKVMNFETDDLAIQATMSGAGIALVGRKFIQKELSSGSLIIVGPTKPITLGYYIMTYCARKPNKQTLSLGSWIQHLTNSQ